VELEPTILQALTQVAQIANCQLIDNINNDTVLLQSGLDSLGFAMLVAQLEEDLGMDPFSEMQIAVYPRTFGEFVQIYQQAAEQASG
jgi:acyl carrier protein